MKPMVLAEICGGGTSVNTAWDIKQRLKRRLGIQLLCLVCLLLTLSPVHAEDLAAANAAFDRGEFVTALELYQSLAEGGESQAMYKLGLMYEQGLGTGVDATAAANWYQQAQQQQSPEALGALADLHLQGRGVIQNFKESVRLNTQAAEAGYAPAQYNLGVAYANGVGTFRDPVRAHMWFNIAAASGYAKASQSRDQLATVMAQAEITRAQQRAQTCMDQNFTDC